jgi:hypothetical protein
MMPRSLLYDVECVVLAALLVAFGLSAAIRRLARTRPELSVGAPVIVGVGLRWAAIAGVAATGVGQSLRGVDNFVLRSREVAASGFDSGLWLPSEAHRLHEIVFALQIKLGDFPDGALEVTQVGIATLGIVLIIAAIYDLAGQRAARLAAWVLALEPASIFFNSFLHREPLLVLASGLVVFGGAKVWVKLELRGVLLLGLGCAIALGTRPYAAWFLMTGGLLLVLHASLRQVDTRLRSLPLIYAVIAAVVVATPAVLAITSKESLQANLQSSQDANTNPYAKSGAANSSNLSLEAVDFSSRADLVTNLPRRVRDIVLRPYPWQVQNTSQQLGAIGTLVVFAMLVALARYLRRARGQIFALTAPVLYPGLCLLMAYALSVGNAGTGFRYRTHLVLLGLAMLVLLRENALRRPLVVEAVEPGRNGVGLRPIRANSGGLVGRGSSSDGALRLHHARSSAARGHIRADGQWRNFVDQ